MIQAARSLRTANYRSQQTGIAEGASFFLPERARAFTLAAPPRSPTSSWLRFVMRTKTDPQSSLFELCCYPPTSLHLLPVLAISQPSRRAADVTEEPSEHLSQRL